jgi:tartrate dehydratase alpha subunit/fumarate hydratase class I-like protein
MGNRLDDGTLWALGAVGLVVSATAFAGRGSFDRASLRHEDPAAFARRFGITVHEAKVALGAKATPGVGVGFGGGTPEQEAILLRLSSLGLRREAKRFAYLVERGREEEALHLVRSSLPRASRAGTRNEFG